jgi:hypothetical protein
VTDFRELAPRVTPLDYPTVLNAILVAGSAMELNFTRAAAKLAAAQIAIETGLRNCPNYCIAGEKSRPNNGATHWQYFATKENLETPALKRAQALSTEVGAPMPKILGTIERDGKPPLTSIMLYPKHPWCCFVAFESLDEAMAHHFEMLKAKFAPGLEALKTGDPAKFVEGLRHGKYGAYFTATNAEYVAGLKYRLNELEGKVSEDNLLWGDVK